MRQVIGGLAMMMGLGGAPAAMANDPDPLAKYQWEARPILIFAPDRYDRRMTEMKGLISAHRREFRDRDIVIIEIGGAFMRADARGLPYGPELRARFGIADDEFAMILIGKDGGEKMRVGEIVHPNVIYDLIDTMPMRQREIEQGG